MPKLLRRLGYRVLCAGSGEEAMQILTERGAPDVAILDVTMPGMSGVELLVKLRADPAYRAVRIHAIDRALDATSKDAGRW
jgi:CheY-like chemotaxis protein